MSEEMKDQEVVRGPTNTASSIEDMSEIAEAFKFNYVPDKEQVEACSYLGHLAKLLAKEIGRVVPDGKHRVVAINNVLGAVLWAHQGILSQRKVEFVAVGPTPCCERDRDKDGNCDRHPA